MFSQMVTTTPPLIDSEGKNTKIFKRKEERGKEERESTDGENRSGRGEGGTKR